MKLGFVSAILDGWNFEEMIDTASEMGFSCVEVACWPCGKAERRYAGVSHINVDELTDEKAAEILAYCAKKGVEISSLAFYPNTMDADLEKRVANVEHLKKVIRAARGYGQKHQCDQCVDRPHHTGRRHGGFAGACDHRR